MAVDIAGERLMASRRPGFTRVLAVALLAIVSACSGSYKRPPTGTAEPDRFLFERGTEQLDREALDHRARVLPATRRQLSAEPVQGRREARDRRHLHRREIVRIVRAGGQRVPRVPDLLPHSPACRLRAVQAGDDLVLPDAWTRTGPDRDARSDQGADHLRRELPAQRVARRGPGAAARCARSPEPVRVPGRLFLLALAVVSRGDRSLQGRSWPAIRSSRTGTRCTSTWPTRWPRFSVRRKRCPSTTGC